MATRSPAPAGPSRSRSSCGQGAFDTYYKNDASYESNSRGDYTHVGDIAYWDDEGYLTSAPQDRHDHLWRE